MKNIFTIYLIIINVHFCLAQLKIEQYRNVPVGKSAYLKISNGATYTTTGLDTNLYFKIFNTKNKAYIMGNFAVGDSVFGTTNIPKFQVIAGVTTSYSLATFSGSINNYAQVKVRNLSSGTGASADLIIENDSSTETSGYLDIGLNSSTYNQATYGIGGLSDGYIYISPTLGGKGGNLTIGTQAARYILFHTGGTRDTNERVRIAANGRVRIGTGSSNPLHQLVLTTNETGTRNIYAFNIVDPIYNKVRTTVAQATDTSSLNVQYTLGGKPLLSMRSSDAKKFLENDSLGHLIHQATSSEIYTPLGTTTYAVTNGSSWIQLKTFTTINTSCTNILTADATNDLINITRTGLYSITFYVDGYMPNNNTNYWFGIINGGSVLDNSTCVHAIPNPGIGAWTGYYNIGKTFLASLASGSTIYLASYHSGAGSITYQIYQNNLSAVYIGG